MNIDILYDVNQILKKNYNGFLYDPGLNAFHSLSKENTNDIATFVLVNDSEFYDKVFEVTSTSNFFAAFKSIKKKDVVVFNIVNGKFEVLINNEKIENNFIRLVPEEREIEISEKLDYIFSLEDEKVFSTKEFSLVNDHKENLGLNTTLAHLQSVLKENRAITNHLIFMFEFDTKKEEIVIHKKASSLNLNNKFIILDGSYLTKLGTKEAEYTPVSFTFLEKNCVKVTHGTKVLTQSVFIRYA